MQRLQPVGLLAGLVAAGCQSYSPAPVDLAAHARRFAERIPDADSIRRFAEQLHAPDPAPLLFDLSDGLTLGEARYVALLFNPELRTMRLRAGVALAAAENAGRWADPELSGDFARILEDVAHPWLAAAAIGITLPITGRPGLERDLAESQFAEALVEARMAEAAVLDHLDATWARWSAAQLTVTEVEGLLQRLVELEAVAGRLAQAQLLTQAEARTFTLERVARQTGLIRANAAVATAAIDLQQLLGLPADRPLPLVSTIAIAARVPTAAARRERLIEGPKVVLAQRQHEVAERGLALAIRKQWPELTLLPGFAEEDAQPRATLGFTLPLPLWNGNAREIAEQRAARDAAAELLRGRYEQATQDLARAEVQRDAALAQRALVDTELVPLAEQQVTDGRRLADLGQLNALLILDALTRSFDAKVLAIEAALAEAEATTAINSLFWPTLAVGNPTEAGR